MLWLRKVQRIRPPFLALKHTIHFHSFHRIRTACMKATDKCDLFQELQLCGEGFSLHRAASGSHTCHSESRWVTVSPGSLRSTHTSRSFGNINYAVCSEGAESRLTNILVSLKTNEQPPRTGGTDTAGPHRRHWGHSGCHKSANVVLGTRSHVCSIHLIVLWLYK